MFSPRQFCVKEACGKKPVLLPIAITTRSNLTQFVSSFLHLYVCVYSVDPFEIISSQGHELDHRMCSSICTLYGLPAHRIVGATIEL